MNVNNFIKKNKISISIIVILSLIIGVIAIKKAGIKDGSMFSLATFFLLLEVYLIFKDKKMSLLLFIISFPILVTGRKFCYFDVFIFSITYESIYISILFVSLFKDIINFLKSNFKNMKFIFSSTLIFAVLALNSTIYADDMVKCIANTNLSVIIPIMFMLEFMTLFNKGLDLDSVINCLIISLDLSCVYGLVQAAATRMTLSQLKSNRELLTFGYNNVNIFAGILIMIMPFIFEKILYKKMNKKERIFIYLSAIITIVALVVTFTRGAQICFIITLFILILDKKYRKLLYLAIVIGVIFGKKVFAYIISRGNGSTSLFSNESTVARIQSIFTSLKAIVSYPFGVGTGNFSGAYKKFAMQGYMSMPENIRNQATAANYSLEMAHNLFLQVAVDLGIIACIVFLVLLINRFVLSIKNYKINRSIPAIYLVYIFFVITTGSEFNHKGIITGTLVLWLLFAITELIRQRKETVNEE